jgi:hypothetical protein
LSLDISLFNLISLPSGSTLCVGEALCFDSPLPSFGTLGVGETLGFDLSFGDFNGSGEDGGSEDGSEDDGEELHCME